MSTPATTPVMIGIGEYTDRPESLAAALEPIALMDKALRAASQDGGGQWLERIDSLDLIGFVTWRYPDPASLLCERLGVRPKRCVSTSMGGETPIRLIHQAALRIATGELTVAAVVGGEALYTLNRAREEHVTLNWTPLACKDEAVRFAADRIEVSAISKLLGVTEPTQMYPLYEMAAQAAWGQTPAQGTAESASLWAQLAAVAAQNPYAWIKTAPSAAHIAATSPDNRLISGPYPKLMVATPCVNQAAAVIVTSLAAARAADIPADRIIHIWGGAAAAEPENYLQRDRYDHSTAQAVTLARAVEIAGAEPSRFGKLELYSCCPIVPKMALRALGLDPATHSPTVTGGLTFFGGPLDNYMTHAVCAMVRALRAQPGELGLLYGQGGFVTQHHALVVSGRAPPEPLQTNYSVQAEVDRLRGPVPELLESYQGPASIETYTVTYGQDGESLWGLVILRTPGGARTLARVVRDDTTSLSLLTATGTSAIGAPGHVRTDPFGKPVWESGARRERSARPYRFIKTERDGPITLVTINRPESYNSLDPATNAELAEVFDAFAADPSQWVAILTGAGERAFSSGNDLKFTAAAMARGEGIEIPLSGFGGLTARFDLTKPVIAAVNGVAMGGGFEIALACDLIIASDKAVFALPEPRVGLAALEGGLLRLPRQIGLKAAMGMILTGRRVGAEEGRQLGFVNEVTRPEELLATARRWAAQILECSPMSIRASKQIVHRGLDEPTLTQARNKQRDYPAVRALFESADRVEGPRAFAQKRPPQWQGQ